ncbi:MAG: TetR/AcrR family transcriptional regulator [Nocardioides sp.]
MAKVETERSVPAPRRRGRPPTQSPDDIVLAATGVLRSRGYSATRYQDISEASGIPVTSVQYHFGSIEDLRRMALVKMVLAESEQLDGLMRQDQPPWTRIQTMIDTIWQAQAEGVRVPTWLLWLEHRYLHGLEHPEIQAAIEHSAAGFMVGLHDAISDGAKSGSFSLEESVTDAINQLSAIVYGLLQLDFQSGAHDGARTRELAIRSIRRLLGVKLADADA